MEEGGVAVSAVSSIPNSALESDAREDPAQGTQFLILNESEYALCKTLGRPPTTGEHVGLAAAKELLLEKEREEIQLALEKQVTESWGKTKKAVRAIPSVQTLQEEEMDEFTAMGLRDNVEGGVKAILDVAKSSGKLKGTYVRKEVAGTIWASTEALSMQTRTDETARLQEENARLKREIERMKKDVEELRKELEELRGQLRRMSLPQDVSRPTLP